MYPAGINSFKANKGNITTICKICSKLTIMTPERRWWYCSGVFIVDFEQIHILFWYFHGWLWRSKCRLGKYLMHWLSLWSTLRRIKLLLLCEAWNLCFHIETYVSTSLKILVTFKYKSMWWEAHAFLILWRVNFYWIIWYFCRNKQINPKNI